MIISLYKQLLPVSFQIDVGSKNDSDLFKDVISVRSIDLKESKQKIIPVSFNFDAYSDHYRLIVEDQISGCLSATRLLGGKIDCQEFYPQILIDKFYDIIVSACKFKLIPELRGRGAIATSASYAKLMIREAWRDQLRKGAKLDLINVEKNYVPYYKRLGYILIENSRFIHPVLGTESYVMFTSADPNNGSILSDVFQESLHGGILPVDSVLSLLNKKQFYYNKKQA